MVRYIAMILSLFTLLANTALAQDIAAQQATIKKPNVILFYVDDLGWKDVSFMGSKYYQTPNIDNLAIQGMLFDNGYANAPNCAPSRASLLSGQYTPRHGIYTVNNPARGKAELRKLIPSKNNTTLDPNNWTMADAFKSAGYQTAAMGKFHVGKDPLDYGFDVNIGGDHKGGPYYGKKYFSPYDNPNLSNGPKGEYITDRLTSEAINFIDQQHGKPFFLYLSHFSVHTPIQAKADLIKKYKNKKSDNGQDNPKYAAMIESVDESLGNLVSHLKKQGLYDNTIIVFTSDNGGSEKVTNAKPLSGNKGSMYEGGTRVPMFIVWPNAIAANSVNSTPVIATDIMPTLMDFIAIEKPENKVLDGISLAPILLQTGVIHRQNIYWHFPAYLQSYKYGGVWRSTPYGAIRQGNYKLIEFFEDGHLELYNLDTDISETTNLASKLPEKVDELHKLMQEWRSQVKAEVPENINPKFSAAALKKILLSKPFYSR